ncbi:glycoside hydrolase family 3 C-terminal domain-containing protein [Streptosporangium sp. NPDC050855]|uniref:beta-glucosidase n=1 Tax=Streptosporangium sp. NPDC050855 TaxID=3366194 RepID=UPI003792FADF
MHHRPRNRRRLALALCLALPATVLHVTTAAHATAAPCAWMDTTKSADTRARTLLDASTLEQKMRWLVEQPAAEPQRTQFPDGVVYPAQVACAPALTYTDGPFGIRGDTGVTAFPAPIAQAASWNPSLSTAKGRAVADEAFRKRRNVFLGPGIASGRTPLNGRTSEYLGEDPLLSGDLAAAEIQGIQKGNPQAPVLSVLKHFVGNEQETDRTLSSSNIDERTLRQIYELPFEIAVKKGSPGGVMCAYNQVNGVHSCENPTLLTDHLRGTIGFGGFVVSDFWAVTSTAPSLRAGLDQELNKPTYWTPEKLRAALAAGQITTAQIDTAAFRVVRALVSAGLFDRPLPATAAANVSSAANQAVARRVAEEGGVLLKNEAAVLPLTGQRRTIAVIGPTASRTPTNGVSASTVCSATWLMPPGGPYVDCPNPVAPLDAITARAARDGGRVVFDDGSDPARAARVAASADVAVVFGYYTAGEFADLPDISLDGGGDALISAVATANPRTVAVLETGGPVLMPWLGKVKAVLQAWYPGVQQGNAIASLLWGDVNPSGKLPQTFPASLSDLPTAGSPRQYPGVLPGGGTTRPEGDQSIRQVDHAEGLKVGYRWYDSRNITPLFPFGHGLSYTTFSYGTLTVTPPRTDGRQPVKVRFLVTNTGQRAGTEVAQVYLGLPAQAGEPPRRLAGWARVTLAPNASQMVEVTLDPAAPNRPLSYWDAATDRWVTPPGRYAVQVGASSRNISLTGAFQIP